jgi:hypothetical protein
LNLLIAFYLTQILQNTAFIRGKEEDVTQLPAVPQMTPSSSFQYFKPLSESASENVISLVTYFECAASFHPSIASVT